MDQNRKKIRLVADRLKLPHLGIYSGYNRLFDYVESSKDVQLINISRVKNTFFEKVINKITYRWFHSRYGNPHFSYCQMLFSKRIVKMAKEVQADIIHISHLEDNYGDPFPFFSDKGKQKLVTTVHQPVSWWKSNIKRTAGFQALDSLIVLSSEQKRYFEDKLPGKVYLIKHGVESNFFKPLPGVKKDYRSCVFSGNWMRDIPQLLSLIGNINKIQQGLTFHIINPFVDDPSHPIYSLRGLDNVVLYKDLSNEQLRDLYCGCAIMVLPLVDCTANNALLEAAACGLPVIVSNVGGVRDYSNDTFCEYIEPGDSQGFVVRVLALLDNIDLLQRRSIAAREYIENVHSWEVIHRQINDVYLHLMGLP